MLLGAALAGTVIESSMLGAAHASANPLTARLGVVHGRAVATMLPHVMRFNATVPAAADTYTHFSALLRLLKVSDLPLLDWVEALVRRSRFPALDPSADLALLAEDATRQWTGKFNPRPLQREDFISLYRRASGTET
jgi:alcohol dehydrogenase